MTQEQTDTNKTQVSEESLWHFGCSNCQKWWSIGDVPVDKMNIPIKKEWFCPWCGKGQQI